MAKTIAQIKEAMLNHRDFYGGDILNSDEIEKAKTKKQLKDILNRHSQHMEMMAVDAESHHCNFVNSLGLGWI